MCYQIFSNLNKYNYIDNTRLHRLRNILSSVPGEPIIFCLDLLDALCFYGLYTVTGHICPYNIIGVNYRNDDNYFLIMLTFRAGIA